MSIAQNKQIVRKLVEEVYGGDLDELDELVSPRFVDHAYWIDRSGLRRRLMQLRRVFPALNFVVEDIFGEADRVAARVRCECFRDSSRSNAAEVIHTTSVFRVVDGQVVEHWGHSDSFM